MRSGVQQFRLIACSVGFTGIIDNPAAVFKAIQPCCLGALLPVPRGCLGKRYKLIVVIDVDHSDRCRIFRLHITLDGRHFKSQQISAGDIKCGLVVITEK